MSKKKTFPEPNFSLVWIIIRCGPKTNDNPDHTKEKPGKSFLTQPTGDIYRLRSREIMYLVASVRLSVSVRSHGSALPSAAKKRKYTKACKCHFPIQWDMNLEIQSPHLISSQDGQTDAKAMRSIITLLGFRKNTNPI